MAVADADHRDGVLTRLAGRLRTGDLVTGISRLLALACLVGLLVMLQAYVSPFKEMVIHPPAVTAPAH